MSPATFSPKVHIGYVAPTIWLIHATETRVRSFFELRSGHPTLPDDRLQRTDRELALVRNGNRDAAGADAALHDDMTSALAHLGNPYC